MNKKIADMLTMAGAVVVGFVIHKLVANFLGMPDASETFSGASGYQTKNCDRTSYPVDIQDGNLVNRNF
jgi:hypothetical protein